MIALAKRIVLPTCLAAIAGVVLVQDPARPLQVEHPTGRLPSFGIFQAEKTKRPDAVILDAHRPVRAGLILLPSLGLDDLAAGSFASPATPVSLRMDGETTPSTFGLDEELPGDPLRDALKARMVDWPVPNEETREDFLLSRFPDGLRPGDEGELAAIPQDAGAETVPASETTATPQAAMQEAERRDGRAFLSESLPRTRSGMETGSREENAVDQKDKNAQRSNQNLKRYMLALALTGAPSEGASPAANHPLLAEVDKRATPESQEDMVEILAANGSHLAQTVSLGSGLDIAQPMPPLAPDEGISLAGKNRGLRGLDDGIARPMMLHPVAYTRAQNCLATAIYFEARGEEEEGQIAVAQVIINRVRSPYYPKDVCSVVYQNAARRNACQFSFACDGHVDRVNDRSSWEQALTLAQKVLDAEAWLPDVGNATHYHANYVRPRWVRDMVKKDRIGRHIFYRVRWWS